MEDLTHGLVRLGLKENEALVYLAVLERIEGGAQAISEATGLARATTYDLLEGLCKKGLVTKVQKGERVYVAESPERIRSLLSYQIRELEERRSYADQYLMRLNVLYNRSDQKPKIRYIESIDGLRLMQQQYEQQTGAIIQILNYDTFLAIHDPYVSKEHRRELHHQSRNVRSIIVTDQPFEEIPGIESVVVPTSVAPIDGEMTVCGDRLVLFSYKNGLIAIEIQSQTIADMARTTLELAWERVSDITKNNRTISQEAQE